MDKPDIVERLEECPFCGARAFITDFGPEWEAMGARFQITQGDHAENCPLFLWEGICFKTRAEAIAAWNQRADNPEITRLRAQLAAAREGLDRIESQALCAGMPADEAEVRSWLVNIASITATTLAALKETDNG